MESTTPTTTTSETDSGAAVTQTTTSAVDDGAGAGSQAAADTFAAERETFESQRRALQSERDRLKAELDKLKAGATPAAPAQTETALTAESVMALLKKDREMTALAADLKGQFTLADPTLFQSYESFDNADAFRVAVENSHNSVKARVEAETQPAIAAAVEAAIAPYIQRYGRLAETPQTTEGAAATGLPTIAQVQAMSMAEMEALVAQHGDDVIDRILRSA